MVIGCNKFGGFDAKDSRNKMFAFLKPFEVVRFFKLKLQDGHFFYQQKVLIELCSSTAGFNPTSYTLNRMGDTFFRLIKSLRVLGLDPRPFRLDPKV